MYYPDDDPIGTTHMTPYMGYTGFADVKQRKTELTGNYMFPKTQKVSWIDYRSLAKTGLSANIDAPCNMFNITIKETPIRSLNITKTF